jgi:hypothetical protein
MTSRGRQILAIAKEIQAGTPRRGRPSDEGSTPETDQVLAHSLVRGTRGYIEKITAQINGCYERGWFDGAAVMIRRLLETLIIEAFEEHGRATAIQNSAGDFLYLRDLVTAALNEPSWNLGRNTKSALPRLKDIGDRSAHSRRYIAHRRDIEDVHADLRVVVQEFIYLAGLK